MQSSSLSISDALSAEEICPLCLDHYTAADECVCVVCRAPSCPGCAESIDADGAMRCYACRPAPVFTQLPARPDGAHLPRPIPATAYGLPQAARALGEPPLLPFPLTSSPHGVRDLKPRPAGSVFVGLPPVPSSLAGTLQRSSAAGPTVRPPLAAPMAAPWAQRASQRARVQLALGRVRAQRLAGVLSERGQRQWSALRARLPALRLALLGVCQAMIARGKQLPVRASLARLSNSELARTGVAQLRRLRESSLTRVRALRSSRRLARLQDARLIGWSRTQLTRAKLWSERQLARPLAAITARLLPRPEKPVVTQHADRPSSISL